MIAISTAKYREPLRQRAETWAELLAAMLGDASYLVPQVKAQARSILVRYKQTSLAVEIAFDERYEGSSVLVLDDRSAELASAVNQCLVDITEMNNGVKYIEKSWFLSTVKCPAVVVVPYHVSRFAEMCFYRRPIIEALANTLKGFLNGNNGY